MKRIGLLGGMSWESTIHYYRIINESVRSRLGGLHSAECVLYSVEFSPIVDLMKSGQWSQVASKLSEAAVSLKHAGAEFLVICTNTMHKVADRISDLSSLEVLHIGDSTAAKISERGINRVALLGTTHTMEGEYYREPFRRMGIELLIPGNTTRAIMDRIIFDELCRGEILRESKQILLDLIEEMKKDGAQGAVLGCTELPNIIRQEDVSIPVFDTTRIHAEAAVVYAME